MCDSQSTLKSDITNIVDDIKLQDVQGKMNIKQTSPVNENHITKTDLEEDALQTSALFHCTKCTKKFTRLQLLKQHQMVHSDTKPFACSICDKRFKKAAHLKTHKLTHFLEESPYKCTQCEKIFTQDASLKLHMQKHRGIRPFLCKSCGKSFPKLYSLQRHEKTHDEEWVNKIKEERIQKNRQKFGPLDKKDTQIENSNITDKNDNFVNLTTNQEYEEIVKELQADLENIKKEQIEETDIAPFLCETVSEDTETISEPEDTNKKFKCSKCCKRFLRLTYLKQHQMTHSDFKPFPCTVCQMRFKKASHLKTHMLTHSEDSPYKCEQCGKKFTQDASLKCHLLVHSGIKPHSCTECGKKFTKFYTLQRHMQTHLETRPYQCDLCFRKFSDASNLKRHEMTHNTKLYHCKICEKVFPIASQLKRHKITHEVKTEEIYENKNSEQTL